MNQLQLQTARAALWHQIAAQDPSSRLLTSDDAARWLDDLGLCLFLPRHTQLPAPAPSFVEACLGAPSVTPSPAVIAQASELAARLIAEDRAVPLNLLGTFSDQPDFLVTPEILPWVAAVRGDRQWKSPPAGRPSPLVMRAWEALEREGDRTAAELQEILGRELTEAALLRALVALWTTLRAMPVYSPGAPTRWILLKSRYSAQLATGANTAQPTALSALLSIYLRSAVAATAEEAEIFLSPITARSRIRDVVHGMMATRQVATMSVASQTLLFVEGSLPEVAPAAEEKSTRETPPPENRQPLRKKPRPTRWVLPAPEATPEPQPGPPESTRIPWQKKPAVPDRPRPPRDERGRRDIRPASSGTPFRPKPPRPGAKPWQRRRPDDRPRPSGEQRTRGQRERPGAKPWQRRHPDDRSKPPGEQRTGGKRPAQQETKGGRDSRVPGRWNAGDRRKPAGPPWKKSRAEHPPKREEGFRPRPPSGSGFKREKSSFGRKPRFAPGARPASGEQRDRTSGPARSGKPFSPRPFSRGPGAGGRPEGRQSRPFRPGKPGNKFRKFTRGKQNPRKNRSQEENPE